VPRPAAAVKLTTRAFAEFSANPAIGRAEALRRSIAELITKGNKLHPSLAKRIASSPHLGGSQDPHEARARPQGSARAWAGPKTAPQPSFFSVPMREWPKQRAHPRQAAARKARPNAGGVYYLRRVAKEDPKTFCTLLDLRVNAG
jgi:hypothetical protein